MMQRRGFLGAMLAAGMAPAVVRSGVLMPVRPAIIVPSGLGLLAAEQKRIDALYIDRMDHAADAIMYGLFQWMQKEQQEAYRRWGITIDDVSDEVRRYNFTG